MSFIKLSTIFLASILLGAIFLSRTSYSFTIHRLTHVSRMAIVTAYSKQETCPDGPCITSSGKVASEGTVACPRGILMGTLVSIEGQIYTCLDHTALKYDGRFDIWREDYQEAINHGIKTQEVTIYRETESQGRSGHAGSLPSN